MQAVLIAASGTVGRAEFKKEEEGKRKAATPCARQLRGRKNSGERGQPRAFQGKTSGEARQRAEPVGLPRPLPLVGVSPRLGTAARSCVLSSPEYARRRSPVRCETPSRPGVFLSACQSAAPDGCFVRCPSAMDQSPRCRFGSPPPPRGRLDCIAASPPLVAVHVPSLFFLFCLSRSGVSPPCAEYVRWASAHTVDGERCASPTPHVRAPPWAHAALPEYAFLVVDVVDSRFLVCSSAVFSVTAV